MALVGQKHNTETARCYGTLNTNNFLFSFLFSDFTFLFLYFPRETMKKARDKEVT